MSNASSVDAIGKAYVDFWHRGLTGNREQLSLLTEHTPDLNIKQNPFIIIIYQRESLLNNTSDSIENHLN